jgi:hypothetical protein
MKIGTTRLSILVIGLALLALVLLVAAPRQAAADTAGTFDTEWFDSFEGYTACPFPCLNNAEVNTNLYFPHATWTHSGLKDSFVITQNPRPGGTKSLKAHGLNHTYGASIAYRAIGGNPPFEIDFWARVNGDEALLPTGGFRKTVGVELGTYADFTSPHRGLLSFTYQDLNGDGQMKEIWGGYLEVDESHTDGVYLGEWVGDTYHHINIKYEPVSATQVRITWTIDNRPPAFKVYDVNWYENWLDYVGLWAAGGQIWFDDVRVTASTDPFNFDTPEPPNLNEKVYLPIIVR